MEVDNAGEFLNHSLRSFSSTHGIALRLSCPYTCLQNGKVERAIRTTSDILRTLLIQAST